MRELVKVLEKWSVSRISLYFVTMAGTFLWALGNPSLQYFAAVCSDESRAVASRNSSSFEVIIDKFLIMK